MKQISNKRRFASNAMWKMIDTVGSKGVSTAISIILARMLLPHDYGIVAISDIFANFSTILIQGGLNTALIRKKEVDDIDYSVTMFASLGVAGFFYIIFFAAAPFIADYYGEPLLRSVLRVQLLDLFICSLGTVRTAIVTREFKFRELCITNIISTIAGGLLGVFFAYNGLGVWALVIYTLIRNFLASFLLFIIVRWKPLFIFSKQRLKVILGFSSWVLLGSIFDFAGNNMYNTVFGQRFSTADLGYYTKGNQLPELVGLHTFGCLTSVLLPTLSEQQEYKERMKSITKKIVKISSYVLFPMMGGLAVVGNRLIPLLFTDKWMPCIPILRASCIYFAVNPFRQINMQVIYASGKSKNGFIVELLRFIMMVTTVSIGILAFNYNIYMIAFNSAAVAFIVALITQHFVKYHIDYGYLEWIKDFLPEAILTAVMCIIVFFTGQICAGFHDIIVLLIQLIVGVVVYWLLSKIFRVSSYIEVRDLIADMIGSKIKKFR